MAPKGALKRPAAAAAAQGPRKRPAAVDPVAVDLGLVAEAVQAAEELPQEVRRMLGGALVLSLGVPKAERHPFQEEVAAMAAAALAKVEATAEAAVARAEASKAAALATKAVGAEAAAAAGARLAEVGAAVARLQEVADEAAQAASAAHRAQKEAEAAERRGNKELDTVAARKQALEKLVQETYAPLKAAAVEGPEGKQRLKALAAAAKKQGVEEGLLTALPAALAKEPSQRGEFDLKVLEQLDGELSARATALEEQLAAGAPKKAEHAAVVQAAREAAEAAAGRSELAQKALEVEKTSENAAMAALDAASAAAAGAAEAAAEAEALLASAEANLAALRAGALAAFVRLRDPPVPPAPIELEEEKAAVPEAPVEAVGALPEAPLEAAV